MDSGDSGLTGGICTNRILVLSKTPVVECFLGLNTTIIGELALEKLRESIEIRSWRFRVKEFLVLINY